MDSSGTSLKSSYCLKRKVRRCSVKPASRFALYFRNQEPLVFTKDTQLNSKLGTGRPGISQPKAQRTGYIHSPTTLLPPLGLQVHATELGMFTSAHQIL
ncbi:hypothetical protein LINPERPRIM_LOCUS38583 [Linum perenne]